MQRVDAEGRARKGKLLIVPRPVFTMNRAVASTAVLLGLAALLPSARGADAAADPAVVAARAAGSKARAIADRDEATTLEGLVERLATRRNDVARDIATARRAFDTERRAAATTRRSAESSQKSHSPEATPLLRRAATEYESALEQGATLAGEITVLRAVQDKLDDTATRATDAAADAKNAALEVEAAKKMLGSPASGAPTAASPERRQVFSEIDAATKLARAAATDAATQATRARGATAPVSSQDRAARTLLTYKADAELRATLAALTAALTEVRRAAPLLPVADAAGARPSPPPAAAPTGPPPADCDIRKVDWGNYPFSSFPLKNGSWGTGDDLADPDNRDPNFYGVSLDHVDYVDLDGDGSIEAMVVLSGIGHEPGACCTYMNWSVFVVTEDQKCMTTEAGAIFKSTNCQSGNVSGGSYYVEDQCDGSRAEYRLLAGSFREVRKTTNP